MNTATDSHSKGPVPGSPQAELEHFRNTVSTLIQELAAERAIREQLQQECLAWEAGKEHKYAEE